MGGISIGLSAEERKQYKDGSFKRYIDQDYNSRKARGTFKMVAKGSKSSLAEGTCPHCFLPEEEHAIKEIIRTCSTNTAYREADKTFIQRVGSKFIKKVKERKPMKARNKNALIAILIGLFLPAVYIGAALMVRQLGSGESFGGVVVCACFIITVCSIITGVFLVEKD